MNKAMNPKTLARVSLLGFSLVMVAVRAQVPETFLTSPLAVLYGTPPTVQAPRLSPDGDTLLFTQQDQAGISYAFLLDFASDEITPITGGVPGQLNVSWCEWASAAKVMCDFRNIQDIFGATETYTFDADGTNYRRVGLCGTEIDWMPEDPDSVIAICGFPVEVSLNSRQTEAISILSAGVNPRFAQIMSDGHGLVRIGQNHGSRDRWYSREGEGLPWTRFAYLRWQSFEDPFRPMGFGEDLGEVIHLAWDGTRWSVYARELSGEFEDRLIYSNPIHDIEHVVKLGPYNRVVAATWFDEIPQQYIFDPKARAAHDIATYALPGQAVEVINESWDQSAYVVRVREPNRAGSLYRVDVADQSVLPIAPEFEQLAEIELAPTRTVQFAGQDGGLITGHLTVPLGRELPVPAVIVPRATPLQQDLDDPNQLIQFLAASGYAVLRVDQRGSPEWGGNWIPEKVLVSWEQGTDDIAAATEFLVDEGIAAPGQFCGVGRDVGAFALLTTDMRYPELLNCIVSIRGISDARSLSGAVSMRVYSMLDDASPIRRANEVTSSLLMFDSYLNRESRDFRDALRRNDDVTLIEYQHSRPAFDRAPHRIDMFARIGEFLGRSLSAAPSLQ